MKYLIGIDIAKFKHTATVLNEHGEVIVKPFDFSNDITGFNLLIDTLKPYFKHDHLIGLEDTGHYGSNLIKTLNKHSDNIYLYNPLNITQFRKATNVAKNDKLDSITIASTLVNFSIPKHKPCELEMYDEIRELTRMHHHEKELLNTFKNRLQKYIDLAFPEYNKLFKTKYSKAYLHILYTFQSADNIAKTDVRTLRKELGASVETNAEDLKAAAKSSVGNSNSALEISIHNTINSIYTCEGNLKVVDKKIEEFSLQLNPSILTIPGIKHFSAMSIIAEIGPIDRFQNAKQLIKFAGVNPFVYESGTKSIEQTAIEKKGSKYLRKTLYQIILPILRFNPVFHNYYKKKRKEGKKDLCAKGHCVRKLLRVIFHLLSTNQKFDPALLL